MKKLTQDAFTLIELMVVIGIIVILVLGATKLNFGKISDANNLDITTVKIIANIEAARNNALLGKGIGPDLYVPEVYKIDFINSGSGEVNSYYSSGSSTNYVLYETPPKVTFNNQNFQRISSLKCLPLDKDEVDAEYIINGTGTIIFKQGNISLSGSCISPSSKILEIEVSKRGFNKTIQINTVNGLISIEK